LRVAAAATIADTAPIAGAGITDVAVPVADVATNTLVIGNPNNKKKQSGVATAVTVNIAATYIATKKLVIGNPSSKKWQAGMAIQSERGMSSIQG
jgi:hypothetical protein